MRYKLVVYGPDREIDFEIKDFLSKKEVYRSMALSFDKNREVDFIDLKTKRTETFKFCKEDMKRLIGKMDWEKEKTELLSLYQHTIRVAKIRLSIPPESSATVKEAKEAIKFDCLDDEITKIESTISELVKDHDELVKLLREMDEDSIIESKRAIESLKRIDSCLKESN